MTAIVPESRPVTAALVAALEGAGLTVGQGSGDGLAVPYSVLYPSSPDLDGSLDSADRYADAEHVVMVHHVAVGSEQAEFQADQVAGVWLRADLVVPGRSVLYVKRDDSQPAQRDEDVKPPLYYVVDTYLIATTPA